MSLDAVVASFEGLPARFAGAPGFLHGTRFRLDVGKAQCDVLIRADGCLVEASRGKPQSEIAMTPGSWHAVQEGRLSGIEAFIRHQLSVRGSIEKALYFETLFARPAAGGLRYDMDRVQAGGVNWSLMSAGHADAEPLVLLHGLGATKASWLTVLPQLSKRYRVIVPDLPGFGASGKPLGRYDAPWFARRTFSLLDELGCDRVLVAGNSMGGRIALEMAMSAPERVSSIACLCPAAAFSYRPLVNLVRLVRPEIGIAVARLPRGQLREGMRSLFARPERVPEAWYDAAIDDFLSVWTDVRARVAFVAAARRVYLDEPWGDGGFWARLAAVDVPSLFVYGEHDVLITPRFAARVRETLPAAGVELWEDCGHAPQMEHPARTVATLEKFFASSRAAVAV